MKNTRGGRPSKLPFIRPRAQTHGAHQDTNQFELGESSTHRAKNWTDEDKTTLVNLVHEQFLLGNFVSGGPTSAAWTTITNTLNASIGRNETREQYKQAWKNFRSLFRKFEELSNKSGWGWDDVEFKPVVPDVVWDEYLKEFPEYKICRFKSFPLFPVMKEMLSETYATGEFRRPSTQTSPTRSPSPVPHDPFGSGYQFVDENTQDVGEPMSTTPISNSSSGNKRNFAEFDSTQASTSRRRRNRTTLFQEEMKNAYLERNEILRQGFQNVPRVTHPRPSQFTLHDAIDKLRQISHVLTENGQIGLLDVFNVGQNLIDTFMTLDDRILRRWVTYVIAKYTPFKDEAEI